MITAGLRGDVAPRLRAWLLLAIALAGCSATCAPAAWAIDFEDESLESTTLSVTVLVRDGTCGAPGQTLDTRTFMRGGMRSRFPSLGPGPFALEATALDETCVVVGRACTDLAAATCPASIEQTLTAVSRGAPTCVSCSDGVCTDASDAGALLDAGEPVDAYEPPDTATLPDGRMCEAAETRCDDDVDDDCDGQTDCADHDCEGIRGSCGDLCGGGVCCSGCRSGSSCVSGADDGRACGTGGNACVNCHGNCGCTAGVCDC